MTNNQPSSRIIKAHFLLSLPKWRDKDLEDLPQICFAGRSNVGKSSLINVLVNQKGLAKTSSTPGRTQALVVFHATLRDKTGDRPFHIVDLPGYGYAKVPLEVKSAWRPMVEGYFRNNNRLRCCVLLLDARRKPTSEDLELMEMMEENEVAVLPVVTKMDKLAKSGHTKALKSIAEILELDDWRDLRPVSSSTRLGLDEILLDLADILPPIVADAPED